MKKAASVILHRDRDGLEVYLVRRSPQLKFFGGYFAFPGGAVDPVDAENAADEEAAFRACAVRELGEETEVDVASDALVFAARFVTPCFSPLRFDACFYLVSSTGQPRVVPGELVEGAWWRPEDAVAAWRRDELLLTPPCLVILEHLAGGTIDDAVASLRRIPAEFEGSGAAIPWTAGYELVPLHCPPLPPSMPTNAFLVGWRRFVVIDPGPQGEIERQHLLTAVGHRVDAGDRLEAIALTHHHVDHVSALDTVLERFDVPVWAHAITGELLSRKLDRELDDGDWIDLGEDAAGQDGWGLRCIFTPGHATGHLAFHDERHRALIAGDLISSTISMYVGSPGGHLSTYLDSLERLGELDLRILYPSHGPPTLEVSELIATTIRHRHERLDEIEKVLAALPGDEGIGVESLATRVYRSIPSEFREFYRRAARASLEHLAEAGRAERRGDLYFRVST